MKVHKAYLFFSLLFLLSSCKVAQVVYTGALSPNIKESDKCYYYENDTIKITYVFWDYKGRMAFGVYNKLDIPIYIDWKKSSYINNNMKYDYYIDRTEKKTTSVSAAYIKSTSIDWANIFGPDAIGATIGTEVSEKEERITFIPPKSYITRIGYQTLMDGGFFTLDGSEEKNVPLPEDTTKHFKSQLVKIDASRPTFVFRNFITYSTKETFDTEQYVSNEFYIRKVMTIKQSIFETYSFYGTNRFYIDQINKSDL